MSKDIFAGSLGGIVVDRGTTCLSKEFAGDGLGALVPEVHSAMSMWSWCLLLPSL